MSRPVKKETAKNTKAVDKKKVVKKTVKKTVNEDFTSKVEEPVVEIDPTEQQEAVIEETAVKEETSVTEKVNKPSDTVFTSSNDDMTPIEITKKPINELKFLGSNFGFAWNGQTMDY